MVNTEATSSTTTSQLPSKEEDAISLEKGREEISTVFSDIFLYYGKCTSVTLGQLTELFLTMLQQVPGGFATRRIMVCTDYYAVRIILLTPETKQKFETSSPRLDYQGHPTRI